MCGKPKGQFAFGFRNQTIQKIDIRSDGFRQKLREICNRALARADTQMTHRKESNTESGHNTKWLITANGPLQS